MSEPLLPKKVRILGRDYKILIKDDMEGLAGECRCTACQIDIQDEQHPVEEADTVLHEILHAIHYLMDIGLSHKLEEHVVRKVATGLTQVFLDNPKLLIYLANVR